MIETIINIILISAILGFTLAYLEAIFGKK